MSPIGSGNGSAINGYGIAVFSTGTANARSYVIQGNWIGTDATGAVPLGNRGYGISLDDRNITVGGPAPGQGNVIAYNRGGVIYSLSSFNKHSPIRGNSIHSNAAFFANVNLIGIDLNADGVVNQLDVDTLVRDVLKTEYGDIDLDGNVSINDFNTFASNFGKAGGWAKGDFDGDNSVSINDFNIFANYFGFINATPAEVAAFHAFAATVPEPTGLAAALGLGSLTLRRRRRASVS